MCMTCGCFIPSEDHGNPANITLTELAGAAEAADISLSKATANIAATLAVVAGLTPTADTEIAKALHSNPGADAGYRLVKSEAPKRFTLGVAYAANKVDVAKAKDGHKDFADPDALEECAWNYLRKGARIGLFHEEGTYGHADVVESYIYRGPDWTVTGVLGDTYVIKAGDWMLGAVWDELGFEAVEKQLANGWSPQGRARRLEPTPYDLAQLRS